MVRRAVPLEAIRLEVSSQAVIVPLRGCSWWHVYGAPPGHWVSLMLCLTCVVVLRSSARQLTPVRVPLRGLPLQGSYHQVLMRLLC